MLCRRCRCCPYHLNRKSPYGSTSKNPPSQRLPPIGLSIWLWMKRNDVAFKGSKRRYSSPASRRRPSPKRQARSYQPRTTVPTVAPKSSPSSSECSTRPTQDGQRSLCRTNGMTLPRCNGASQDKAEVTKKKRNRTRYGSSHGQGLKPLNTEVNPSTNGKNYCVAAKRK